ncbi:hypothetical protein [Nocardiopsis sp. L17-MgMaSL7]|nr:hypothetical protein [Nocardiopsis sp. L17-MgMaSL7]
MSSRARHRLGLGTAVSVMAAVLAVLCLTTLALVGLDAKTRRPES